MLKRWQFWLGVLISVIFVYVALKGLDLQRAWEAMKTANYWWILPGVVVYFFAVWARTWRWHYMLRPIKPVSLTAALPGGRHRLHGQQRLPGSRRRADPRLRSAQARGRERERIAGDGPRRAYLRRRRDAVVRLLLVAVHAHAGLAATGRDRGQPGLLWGADRIPGDCGQSPVTPKASTTG